MTKIAQPRIFCPQKLPAINIYSPWIDTTCTIKWFFLANSATCIASEVGEQFNHHYMQEYSQASHWVYTCDSWTCSKRNKKYGDFSTIKSETTECNLCIWALYTRFIKNRGNEPFRTSVQGNYTRHHWTTRFWSLQRSVRSWEVWLSSTCTCIWLWLY